MLIGIFGHNKNINSVSNLFLDNIIKNKNFEILLIDSGQSNKDENLKYISENDFFKMQQKDFPAIIISFIGKGSDNIKDTIESNYYKNAGIIKKIILKNHSTPVLICNSIVSQKPYEGIPEYTASKFAIDGYIKSLRFFQNHSEMPIHISQLHFQSIRYISISPIINCINAWLQYPYCNYDFIIDK